MKVEKRVFLFHGENEKKWHVICYPSHIPDDEPIKPGLEFLTEDYFDVINEIKHFFNGGNRIMIRSHFDYVHDKICWHRFLRDQLSGTCDTLRTFMGKYKIVSYEELKEYLEITERIKFLSEQFYDAEHDLIDLAIRYNVSFTRLLKGEYIEGFYTLLEDKAKQMDKKGVLLIRKE